MSELRGVCTKLDGSIAVLIPADECIRALMFGGYISTEFTWRQGFAAWLGRGMPLSLVMTHWRLGHVPKALAKAWEIEKFVREKSWQADNPNRKALASLWVDALDRGGLTYHEAVRLIFEKDVPPGTVDLEGMHVSELPQERTYRNAWRRSTNGGPVWIDEEAAIKIMWQRHEGEKA